MTTCRHQIWTNYDPHVIQLKTLARARQARKSLEDLLQGDEAAMARYQALLQKMGSK